jgi:MFS family permease
LQSRTSSASPARIAVLWFGIQLTWGAVIGLCLQARCAQLGGPSALSLFALAATSGAIAAAVTQLIVGPWSDRVQRARASRSAFYIAGIGAGAPAVIAFFAAPTAVTMIAAFVALQISLNTAIGPYQAIVPDTMSDDRIGVGSAWIAAMQGAGNALGAVLASMLGASIVLGVVLAASLVLTAATTLLYLRGVAPHEHAPVRFSLRAIFADLFISRGFVYLGFYTLVGYLFFFAQTVVPGDATRTSGIAILIFTMLGTVGAILAAKPSDRSDERLVVFTGAGLMAVAVGALALLHTLVVMVAAVVVAGIGWGIFLCADWAIACRILPRHAMAGTMAVWNLAVLFPQMLAPPVASAVLALTGTLHAKAGPAIAIGLAAAEMIVGAVWIWRLPSKRGGN